MYLTWWDGQISQKFLWDGLKGFSIHSIHSSILKLSSWSSLSEYAPVCPWLFLMAEMLEDASSNYWAIFHCSIFCGLQIYHSVCFGDRQTVIDSKQVQQYQIRWSSCTTETEVYKKFVGHSWAPSTLGKCHSVKAILYGSSQGPSADEYENSS